MAKQIVIIDGHPDPDAAWFCHAIAGAYAEASQIGDHVRRIEVAQLEFPILRMRADWDGGEPVAAVRECQKAIAFAQQGPEQAKYRSACPPEMMMRVDHIFSRLPSDFLPLVRFLRQQILEPWRLCTLPCICRYPERLGQPHNRRDWQHAEIPAIHRVGTRVH
jgi:hypothetical protein